jgi:hypothetical protein
LRFVKNSNSLDDLVPHGIKEIAKLWNAVPEQPKSALQVSDFWHKIKGRIGPNLAFLYGGHNLGWRATKKLVIGDSTVLTSYICIQIILLSLSTFSMRLMVQVFILLQ